MMVSDVAATVKKNGSIIWAQTPDSSTCASQPQSMIESNQVTFVGTPKAVSWAANRLMWLML